jgi:aryl-alcohol dehydrogenase-like predicted oxidoreductase
MGAWHIADKHHLHKPVVEQPQYNLFHRMKVEQEFARLYDELGIGTTIWSPLASGLLTGKYANGIPADSRGSLKNMAWMQEQLVDPARNAIVGKLAGVAKDLDCTTAQLAIAWCLKNPRVSSVITGASRLAQVSENMKALEVVGSLTPEVMCRIQELVGTNYD